MKNSRLTVVSICLFMLLGISLQAVQAKVNNVANYFEPLQNQWALLTVDFANAYKPSTARDKMIQEGVTADIAVDVSLLKLRESAETVQLLLSAGIHDKPLWASGLKPADSHVALPHLPRGAWWLLVKAMDHDGVVVQIKHLFLNVIESTIDTIPQWAGNENDTLAAWQSDNQLLVNVPSKTQSSLSLVFNKLDGTTLHQQRINLQNKSTKPLVVSLDWLSPGITAYVTLKSQQDEYRVLVGKKGHYPAIKPDLAMPGVKPVTRFAITENMTAFGPYAKQGPGFEATLQSMSERGSDAVTLGLPRAQVTPLEGVYDWSDYDQYVTTLTKHKVPFLLNGLVGALFDTHPMDTWGQWMQTDDRDIKVWRKLPTVSPFSDRFINVSLQITRHAIERYKDTPYLVGYNFSNHGGDSFLFHDHFDRITDYSPQARAAFRLFLREKYSNVQALNTAWGTTFNAWDAVMPVIPDYNSPVNLHPAWQDFNAFRLKSYSGNTTELFDKIVDELDPSRLVVHYVAYSGPVEYIYQKVTRDPSRWMMCDGGGEHHTMDRLAGLAGHYGFPKRSESHYVPPAKLTCLKGVFTNNLRYGTKDISFALVWNSLPSLRLSHYPKNEKLIESMAWWKQAMEAYKQMPPTSVMSNDVAVMLSWEDMFYRRLAWRWYALPGEWARTNLGAMGIANASWVSAITPQKIWQQSKVLLAPDDATIWSDQMVQQVQQYLNAGKHLVVLGKSGQYSLDGSDDFAWVQKLGGQFKVDLIKSTPTSVRVDQQNYTVSSVLKLTAKDNFKPMLQTPGMVQWAYGKGTITWILGDTGQTGDMASIDSGEQNLAALMRDQLLTLGAKVHVSSSDPRVTGYMLEHQDKRYVLISYYISMRKPKHTEPIPTLITLPQMRSGNWQLKSLIPSQPEPQLKTVSNGQKGFMLDMTPGECLLYEVLP